MSAPASAEPRFEVNVAQYRQQIDRFTRETGQDASVFFLELYRMLVEVCYHWTAPPTKGRGAAAGGRSAGKKAVASDIYKTSRAVWPAYITFLQRIAGSSYIESLTLHRKGGGTYTLQNIHLNPSGNQSDLLNHHTARRQLMRNGRVPGRHNSSDPNRNKMFTTARAVARFIRDEQRKVGKLKAGWSTALKSAGSKLPPAWVTRAGAISGTSGTASGTFARSVDREQFRGFYEGTNRTPYFRDPSMISRAHTMQERAMQTKLKFWVQQQIDKYNRQAEARSAA